MKRFFTILVFAILFGGSAIAYDFSAVCSSGQTLYYNITSDIEPYKVEVTREQSYTPTGVLEIPGTVEYNSISYSVTSIGDYAFTNCNGLTSVTIPNSVTSIGGGAFSGCSGLTTVTIPNSVTSIGNYAFTNCNGLTSVTIPNSVTSIGGRAFSGCSGLTTITIPNSVTRIGQNPFYNTGWYNNQPDGILYVDGWYLGIKGNTNAPNGSLTIQDGTKGIAYGAFSGCTNLTSVTIPNSVTSIGEGAFSSCIGLTTVNFNAINCRNNSAFSAFSNCTTSATLNIGTEVTEIPNYVFNNWTGLTIVNFNATNCTSAGRRGIWNGCTSFTTLNIGENVTNIPSSAFYGCSYLVGTLTIPNSVTSIGEDAFEECTGLTTITIPNSVNSIGNSAFSLVRNIVYSGPASGSPWGALTVNGFVDGYLVYSDNTKTILTGCSTQATSVTIPNSVIRIGYRAFYNCSRLTSLTIPNSVTSIGYEVFNGTEWYNNQPDGILYLDDWCLGYKGDEPIGELTITEGSRGIADFAFSFCRGLTSLTIPNSVTIIGPAVFQCCSGLTSLTIGNSVTSIGDYAFNYCSGLTSITIPNSVTNIGDYAFNGCSGLTYINIPYSVTSIGKSAFSECSGLENIVVEFDNTVYDSRDNCNAIVQTQNNKLISGCKNSVITNSVTSIGDYAFNYCSGLTSITIPNSVTNIGDHAFSSCRLTGTLTIPNSVTSIGNSAFCGCSRLTSVTIGEGVTSIGDSAFWVCNGLTEVTIGSSVESIGDFAFSNCDSITKIYVNADIPPILGDTVFCSMCDFNYENFTFIYNCSLYSTATLLIPCGTGEAYRSDEKWGSFEEILESRAYLLHVESSSQMGTARIAEAPDCGNGTAVIEAVASEGYAFLAWTDGNTDNPRTIEINSDTTFTATFAEARTVTVEVADSEMGSVIGSGVYAEGAEIQITAIPNENYRFDHWIDVENPTRNFNTDNPRTIVVSSDVSYIAVFELNDGIEENFSHGVNIFPTTATDILNITSSETISEIEIVNMMGQVVYRAEANSDNAVCNVEGLKAGVYFVKIYGNPRTSTGSANGIVQKFIKE